MIFSVRIVLLLVLVNDYVAFCDICVCPFVWYSNWFFILASVPLLSFNIISFFHFFFLLTFDHGNMGMCLRHLLYIFDAVICWPPSPSPFILYIVFLQISHRFFVSIFESLFYYYLIPLFFLIGVGSLLSVVVSFTVTSPQPGFGGFPFLSFDVSCSRTFRGSRRKRLDLCCKVERFVEGGEAIACSLLLSFSFPLCR